MAAGSVHIYALADPDLAQMFKNLPPFDRLRVSEVCRRCWAIGQDPWCEVSHLELVSIPSESIGPIVRRCPNLTSLYCKDQELILDDLRDVTLASLKSMELHGCIFISHDNQANKTTLPLFRSEYGQSMEELVLYAHNYGVECELSERYSQRLLPVSLKRLQLSGLDYSQEDQFWCQHNYFLQLRKLRSLESLILHVTETSLEIPNIFEYSMLGALGLSFLKNLRELLLPTIDGVHVNTADLVHFAMHLPKLEILILPMGRLILKVEKLLDLFGHPTLHILVIPGYMFAQEMRVPVRTRFPNRLGAEPRPLLHVFVGRRAAELLRFDDSPANELRVHRIDAPFPEMLDREEIAEIFEGSWIAEQIKEGARRGINFWTYEDGLVDSA